MRAAALDPSTTSDVVLRPSRLKWGLMSAASVGLIALGVGEALRAGSTGGVLGALGVAAIFLLVLAVSVVMLTPGQAYLRLSAEGFEVRFFGRGGLRRWSDVESASVRGYGRRRRVEIQMRSGRRQTLSDGYSLTKPELAAVLNRWRDHHASDAVLP